MKTKMLRSKGLLYLLFAFICLSSSIAYAQKSSDDFFQLAKKEGNVHQNFSKALEYCKEAAKLAPLDMDIQEYLGKCYLELGQLEQARIVLLKVLDKSPKRVDARHYLLNIETQTKRYSSAICYANELLEITPYSKTLWQRKIGLYNMMDNKVEASRATKRLYQIFPEDQEVRALYQTILKEEALASAKSQDLSHTAKQYEKSLEFTNDDPEVYVNLVNTYIKLGDYTRASETADKGLYYFPYNRELITRKVGILQERDDYYKAIAFVEEQNRKMPSPYYAELLKYLRSEMAMYYRNTDPYTLYGQIYESDKSNKDAYDYLLNTSLSRGYYPAADELIEQGLKSNPNSKDLLSKQLYLYELQQNKPKEEATLNKLYALYPNDSDVLEKYNTWSFIKAKADYKDKNYQEAEPAFLRLSQFRDYHTFSQQYLFAIYLDQGEYDQAATIIDDLIVKNPDDHQHILRKADLLLAVGDYQQAYDLVYSYSNQYPNEAQLQYAKSDISVKYIKHLNEEENFEQSAIIATNLMLTEPNNPQAYRYAIGAFASSGNYAEAKETAEMALVNFPENRDFRLSLADIHSKQGEHQEAVAILKELNTEYPYNSTIKGALLEELYLLAKQHETQRNMVRAKIAYREMLVLKPKDTLSAIKLTKILIREKTYLDALSVVNSSLKLNPNHNELTYLKGQIYEKQENYAEAVKLLSLYEPACGEIEAHKDYLGFLESQLLKNQVNVSYLRSSSDYASINTSIATFEYLRLEKKNTYIARINYAAKEEGVGVQAEADWYHTFEDKSYFIANAGVSNKYFPELKAGLSYFVPFKEVYFGELGARYAKLRDDRNLLTGIIGIEREFSGVWLNLKGMILSDSEDLYHNILLQSRFYLDNDKDYITVMASAGTAPEDQKLDFQTNTMLSYVNTMVGGGYFRNITYRTSFGVMGNWYNFKIAKDYYVNQYNLFLTIKTKF